MNTKSHSPQESVPPPLAGGGRGRGRARVSEHAVEGQRAALEVREGAVAPYLAHRHSRKPDHVPGGNPVSSGRMTLGNALPIKYGKSKSESHGEPCEDVAVYGSSGKIGTFNRRLTSGPTLIVGRKGSAGTIHYSPEPCWPIDTVYYTEQSPGRYLPYFRYLLESLRLGQYDRSTAIPSLSRDDYDAIEVNVPPEDEQRRVVAELETQLTRLDASVTALKRVQANLKCYARATIREVTEPKNGTIWPQASISDLATSLDHQRRPVNKTERANRHGDIPYLGANGRTGWIDDFLFDEELVLVVEDETFVGRTAPFSYYFSGKCWVNNHTHILRAKRDRVLPKYLNFALSYYPFVPLTTGSTGRRKLTKKAMMEAPLCVPDVDEQVRIIAEVERRLSVIEELEATVAANLQRAERLRQTILSKSFSANSK